MLFLGEYYPIPDPVDTMIYNAHYDDVKLLELKGRYIKLNITNKFLMTMNQDPYSLPTMFPENYQFNVTLNVFVTNNYSWDSGYNL